MRSLSETIGISIRPRNWARDSVAQRTRGELREPRNRLRTVRPRWLAAALRLVLLGTVVAGLDSAIAIAAKSTPPPQWQPLPPGPADGRTRDTVVWTGRELIVWGGEVAGKGAARADGAAFSPSSDRWRRISRGPLVSRSAHVAVWTGHEMIVWGGSNAAATDPERRWPNDAAAYNPRRYRWRRLPRPPLQAADLAVGIWARDEVIVWGGSTGGGGAAYRPSTNHWRRIADGPLEGRTNAAAVWTGDELLIWGGTSPGNAQYRSDGAAYDPERDAWRRLPEAPLGTRSMTLGPPVDGLFPLQAAIDPDAVWTGEEMIVWGLLKSFVLGTPNEVTGAAYDPESNHWRKLSPAPVDFADDWDGIGGERTVWADDAMLAWTGNLDRAGARALRYEPGSDSWSRLATAPGIDPLDSVTDRTPHLVWTGDELIVLRTEHPIGLHVGS